MVFKYCLNSIKKLCKMKVHLILISFFVLSSNLFSQDFEYKVGTTSALWKNPKVEDFKNAKIHGIDFIEVAFNQFYRGVPADEVIQRIQNMKLKVDSAGINVWSIHLPFSRTLDISVLNDSLRKENVKFKRIFNEHIRLEQDLEALYSLKYFPPEVEVKIKEIKKKKLLGKDKMEQILASYQ